MKKTVVILVVVVIIAVMAGAISYLRPRIWTSVNSAKVMTMDGTPVDGGAVYRSPSGKMLIHATYSYIFFPDSNKIGLPAGEFHALGSYLYSKDLDPPVVWMGKHVKVDVDPEIIASENSIEFTTSEGVRLKVDLGDVGQIER